MKTRTGWMGGLIAMTVLALSVAANAQAEPEEWDVEWWSGETETNPYTNAAGVVWGIYEGVNFDWSTYSLMIWNGTVWIGPNNYKGFPFYTSTKKQIQCTYREGALTFDSPANFKTSGRFSLYGTLRLDRENPEIIISVLHAPDGGGGGSDDFTELFRASVKGNSYNLANEAALQEIHLGAGERIVFIARQTAHNVNGAAIEFEPDVAGSQIVGISWEYVPPKGTVLYIR